VEFRILGPLEVVRDGEPVRLGGPREKTTIAMLLLEAGNVIPVDRLIDAVWDDEPPATARAQIQICISALRRIIAVDGGSSQIETHSPGYLLRLGRDTLDSDVFDTGIAAARRLLAEGDLADAAAGFRDALSMWRGPALSNVVGDLVQHSVAHLNERRLNALEVCLDTELRAGTTQDIVGELVKAAHEHPLDERFRILLMTALHRSGRQAEALEVYRTTRNTLMDELGIEPGLELRRLHQAILAGGPALEPVREAEAAPRPAPQRTQVPVPMLLPAAIPDFTGRTRIADRIVAELTAAEPSRAMPVIVVYGQGGAGKTTLAVHVAHRLAEEFPDGHLFARLRAGDRPVKTADVLERFLRALGVAGPALPEGVEERAEMYRDLLGRRRILVVLDDAMTEQQLFPLLPGGSRCSVLVTSRRRLTGLPTADRFEVGAFGRRSAVELVARIAGAARVEAEPDAVAELCRQCGHLPLALRIVAGRLAARPHWSIRTLVDRLLDESRRLDELNHGEMGVRASISLTYEALSPDARRLFRRLAVSEAPNFASWVGSPLLQIDALLAEDLLEELTEAYLIDTEPGPADEPVRYRFHDITRPFARERLLADESPAERHDALEHLVGALLFLAAEAHRREYAGDYPAPAGDASRWPLPPALTDRLLGNPLDWYERERTAILAAVRQAAAGGLVEHSWDLALCAATLFEARSYFTDWHETHETALKAVCKAGHRKGEAAVRYSLGSAHMFEQQNDEAMRHFKLAAALYEQLGDRHGAALVLGNTALIDRRNGDLERALAGWTGALGTFREVGDRVAEAHVLDNLAQIRLDYGAEDEAFDLLSRAARICEETGNRRVGAQVHQRLGDLYLQRGDLDRAAATYSRVLDMVGESGDRVGECYALIGLGVVDLRRGRLDSATPTLTSALDLAIVVGDRMVESRAALALAEAKLGAGLLDAASGYVDRALHNSEDMGVVLLTLRALMVRGRIHWASGSPADAAAQWRNAATIMSGIKLGGSAALAAELDHHLAGLAGAVGSDPPPRPAPGPRPAPRTGPLPA